MMLLAGANESYRGALLGRKMQIVTRKLNIMRPSFNLITTLMPQIIVNCAFSFSSEGKPIVCEVSSMGKKSSSGPLGIQIGVTELRDVLLRGRAERENYYTYTYCQTC